MSHTEAISKIRNRQVAQLLEAINGDQQPHSVVCAIKKAFNQTAANFEEYVTEITKGTQHNEYTSQDYTRFNR